MQVLLKCCYMYVSYASDFDINKISILMTQLRKNY